MAGNRNEEMVYCSFCGKNQEEVKKIIAGNGVFICNECVALSQEIIREETAEEVSKEYFQRLHPHNQLLSRLLHLQWQMGHSSYVLRFGPRKSYLNQ